jgi:hypothetical protein
MSHGQVILYVIIYEFEIVPDKIERISSFVVFIKLSLMKTVMLKCYPPPRLQVRITSLINKQ